MDLTKWTSEQRLAIETSGSNIIVSAGAGSGKTAVLSERVLYKIFNGVKINELLILTFTNAAAREMKDRIRSKIKSKPDLKESLDALDSAYITTFDSFALSVLKKYHYLLNLPKNIKVTDESIVKIKKNQILDEVFEEEYIKKESSFLNLVKNYSVKNDNLLRSLLLSIANKIENFIDKDAYIDFIKNEFFTEKYLDKLFLDYKELIINHQREISLEYKNLTYLFDSDYIMKVENVVLPIISAKTLEELNAHRSFKIPNAPRGSQDEAKETRKKLKESIDKLYDVTFSSKEEMKENILSTKPYCTEIIRLVKLFFEKLETYKRENNIFTFQDIALLSIEILKNYEEARLELKNSFKEIMIDEYQDTNNIQETFINLIANNNVYMVGDIKQSIYKFRGSNPSLFKSKYDNYSENNGGIKIDLTKNFRSRYEVLDNINKIFNLIMDNTLGGAEYSQSHNMIFGNNAYEEEKKDIYNYECEVLKYENEKDSKYENYEIEIFAIAKDIQSKMKLGIKVFDKKTSKLRDATYSDFVIILDRSKYFDDYKKIFEYLNIPLTILRDENLSISFELSLIKNIIDFIIKINNKEYDQSFKYDFVSIARSFLYEHSDEYIFDCVINNKIKETVIYKDFSSIDNYNSLTVNELLIKIFDITDMYNKLSKVGDYKNTNIKLSKIFSLASETSSFESIEDYRDYLDEVVTRGLEIKYTTESSDSESVKIMTVHKSKGLEYPICYFADLAHDFNTSDIKSKFITHEKYGLIIDPEDETEKRSVLKNLVKLNFQEEEVSEKIRLLYVALTRAREKMVIVLPNKDINKLEKSRNGAIKYARRVKFKSLASFIYSVESYLPHYFKNINIEKLNLTKKYLYSKSIKNIDLNSKFEDFTVVNIEVLNSKKEYLHYSKDEVKLLDKKTVENMSFGTRIHEIFELIDFKNVDYSLLNSFEQEKVKNFLNNEIVKNIKDATIYKEFEFIFEEDNNQMHGIIDLLLEYDDHFDIIDYKLKNVDDKNYIKQLNGYKDYINKKSNKKVNLYLYTIVDEKFIMI